MKYLTICFALFISLCSCLNAGRKMSVISLRMMDTVVSYKDNGKTISSNKFEYFLIKDYRNNRESQAYIDNFSKKNKNPEFKKYTYYHMIFYKESDETNIESIRRYIQAKGNFYQNLDDLIYTYDWYNGKFLARYKFDNGKIIESKSRVTIKNVPIQADSVKN
ncbi:MAG: hypothetical protein JWR02_2513 [Mucilaginibacter sp.]|nr:hypothetical protein [Mucilaginibacter sp.]